MTDREGVQGAGARDRGTAADLHETEISASRRDAFALVFILRNGKC